MGVAETIFVVEDEADVAEAMTAVLHEAGYNVRAFGSAEEALPCIQEREPHVLVSDVFLKGVHGVAFAEQLSETHPCLPILLLSGHAEAATLVQDACARGRNLYVHEKPMHPHQLLLEIEILLSQRKRSPLCASDL